jgi:hypothetical protein
VYALLQKTFRGEKMSDTLEKIAKSAAEFRPSFSSDDYANLVMKKDMENSRLRQELETERQENSRLRARLEKAEAGDER